MWHAVGRSGTKSTLCALLAGLQCLLEGMFPFSYGETKENIVPIFTIDSKNDHLSINPDACPALVEQVTIINAHILLKSTLHRLGGAEVSGQ